MKQKTYDIKKIRGDIDWKMIPELNIDNVLWTDDHGIRAKGQLCCDDENLYVHMSAVEKEIRAENTEPFSPVYEDSCLEFFFMLPGSDSYFNFEMNPNGVLNIEFGPVNAERFFLSRPDLKKYFDIRTGRTKEGWELYYKIPLKFIRLLCPEYKFEGEISANMYKCGSKTVNRHYLSWANIDLERPNFHCPQYFSKMYFVS